jgi:hypothetical protein
MSLLFLTVLCACNGGNPTYFFRNPKITIEELSVDSSGHLVLLLDIKNTGNDELTVEYLEVMFGSEDLDLQRVYINQTLKPDQKVRCNVKSKTGIGGLLIPGFQSKNRVKVRFRIYRGMECLNWQTVYVK